MDRLQREEEIKERLFNRLNSAHQQLLTLLQGLTENETRIQLDELRGPLVWDVGHSAWFEELWVLRNRFGEKESCPGSDLIFDNEKNHKRTRQVMKLPYGAELIGYREGIHQRTFYQLEKADFDSDNPLTKNGFVFDLVLNHELQHREIMVITLGSLLAFAHPAFPETNSLSSKEQGTPDKWFPGEMVEIPEGEFWMGASGSHFSYDNEKPAHLVFVPRFFMDRFKTSNQEYLEFIQAGGYRHRDYWTEEGWQWIQFNQVTSPDYWRYDPHEGWLRKSFGGKIMPLKLSEPVSHVSWHEAVAYARFRGKRLLTEEEWERAASLSNKGYETRIYPWGNTEPGLKEALLNLNGLSASEGPLAPVWAYQERDNLLGVRQLIGNVWEWTSSPFKPYPGFKAYPYAEYSKIFMGDEFKILKGGSWATSPWTTRNTFRNFYLPHHRNVIAGIRLARSSS